MTILDMVRVTTVTTGNGVTINLGSNVAGFQTWANAGAANNTIYSYGIRDASNQWEIGQGTYITNGSGIFLLRTVVNYSSNTPNSMISLSGSAAVYSNFLEQDYDTFTPANSVYIGNSTANSFSNSTIQTLANSTGQTVLTPITLLVGNTTANYVGANSTKIFAQNSSANTLLAPGTATFGNSIANLTANGTEILLTNATANVIFVPGQAQFGNATVNVAIYGLTAQTQSQNSLANSFVLPGQAQFGNSVANVGVYGLSAQVSFQNSSANTFVVPGAITLAGTGSNQGLILGTHSFAGAGNTTTTANGYSFLPNGLLMQWGSLTAVNSTAHAWVFPTAFPTACFAVVATGNSAIEFVNGSYVVVTTSNTTTFTAQTANASSVGCTWMAVGN